MSSLRFGERGHPRRLRAAFGLLTLFALLGLPGRSLAGAEPAVLPDLVELTAGRTRQDLVPYLRYAIDSEANAEAMFARARSGNFAPLPAGRAVFGYQRAAFWFHLRLLSHDDTRKRWLLVHEYALSDFLDLYLRYYDGRVQHVVSGDRLPFAQRAVKHRLPSFWLDLPPGQPVELLLRVQSEGSMLAPLVLYTPRAFTDASRDGQLVMGLYYGILFALLGYNFFLWLGLRDASYLWYLFHVSAFGLSLLCHSGLAYEYFWPDSPGLQQIAQPLTVCLAQIAMQQFARQFLQLGPRWRLGDRVSLGLIAFYVILLLGSFFLPYRIVIPLASAVLLPNVAWIALVSIVSLRRGYAPAKPFLLAWLTLLLGLFVYSLVSFGVVPKVFLTEWGVQFGSALEMILLAVALSHRYAALRNENERIVREAKDLLESRVAERTQELDATHDELRRSHQQLLDAQQQLVIKERMAALGTLTAGVAHEINNPINFADGSLQQLLEELSNLHAFLRALAGDDAPAEILIAFQERFAKLDELTITTREGHQRIKRIVLDLRQFTRLDEAERKVIAIAEPIQSAANLLRTRFQHIRFELNLDFNPSFECQPAKLGQVFMSLIVNACEAIERVGGAREGLVSIRTRSMANDEIEIAVEDNGCGMDAATQARVFEPFFTTKPVGAGTGLGLATAFGIVKDHGGRIEVESTLGAGTRFTVGLPAAPASI